MSLSVVCAHSGASEGCLIGSPHFLFRRRFLRAFAHGSIASWQFGHKVWPLVWLYRSFRFFRHGMMWWTSSCFDCEVQIVHLKPSRTRHARRHSRYLIGSASFRRHSRDGSVIATVPSVRLQIIFMGTYRRLGALGMRPML